jgi:hypothetical protein
MTLYEFDQNGWVRFFSENYTQSGGFANLYFPLPRHIWDDTTGFLQIVALLSREPLRVLDKPMYVSTLLRDSKFAFETTRMMVDCAKGNIKRNWMSVGDDRGDVNQLFDIERTKWLALVKPSRKKAPNRTLRLEGGRRPVHPAARFFDPPIPEPIEVIWGTALTDPEVVPVDAPHEGPPFWFMERGNPGETFGDLQDRREIVWHQMSLAQRTFARTAFETEEALRMRPQTVTNIPRGRTATGIGLGAPLNNLATLRNALIGNAIAPFTNFGQN